MCGKLWLGQRCCGVRKVQGQLHRNASNIKFYKNHISWDSWRSIGMGISEWDEIKFINECCNGAVLMASTLYKGNFMKYKGKVGKSVFWNSRRLNIFKSCLMALVYISSHYNFTCQMPQIWHCWHKWRIWNMTFVIVIYGNMSVKRSIRTSGM